MLVGKNWKVEADDKGALNVILWRRNTGMNVKTKKQANSENWTAYGYYATVRNALDALVDQGVRDTGLVELRAVVARIDEIHAMIKDALAKSDLTKTSTMP